MRGNPVVISCATAPSYPCPDKIPLLSGDGAITAVGGYLSGVTPQPRTPPEPPAGRLAVHRRQIRLALHKGIRPGGAMAHGKIMAAMFGKAAQKKRLLPHRKKSIPPPAGFDWFMALKSPPSSS